MRPKPWSSLHIYAMGRGEARSVAAVLVVVWFSSLPSANAVCDIQTGPPGSLDCFLSAQYYDGYQWGTCLSNDYIRTKSKGTEKCRNPNATFCYSQCMAELYKLYTGNVTSDCACNPNVTISPPSGSTLPQDCYSPTGTDCNWFKNCLEKKYLCSGVRDQNAITFAENFCRLYEDKSYLFSASGKQWVDAVRKCLQVELTPLMRAYTTYTCDDVKKRALRSHFACYEKPYSGVKSICSQAPMDFWYMFWIIRSSFITSYSESLVGLLKISKTCVPRANQMQSGMRKVAIKIRLKSKSLRQRRAADPDFLDDVDIKPRFWREINNEAMNEVEPRYKREASDDAWEGETDDEEAVNQLTSELADLLAQQLGWKVSGVQWFAYGIQLNSEQIHAFVFLADKEGYGISDPVSYNLSEVVQRAAQAFQNGDIIVTSLGGEPVELQTMSGCSDIDCESVYLETTAPSSAPPQSTIAGVTGLVLAALVRLLK